MKIYDELALLLKTTDKKHYTYVSKNSSNLRKVSQMVVEQTDMGAATSKCLLTHPIGIHLIQPIIDVVFADKGDTSEEHLRKHIVMSDDAKLFWVNGKTLEIET